MPRNNNSGLDNPHVASSLTTVKKKITEFVQNNWVEEWRRSTKGLIIKTFFKSPKAASILKTFHLIDGLAQILTGHNKLLFNQHRLSIVVSPLCNFQEEAETV